MKISVKQYAQSFYDSTHDKTEGQIKTAIENFIRILAANNDLKKTEKIIADFIRIYNQEKGLVEAQVKSAGKLDKGIVNFLNDFVMHAAKAKEVKIEQEIDEAILGGIIIKYGDKILDASLKTRLSDLKNYIKK